MNISLPESVAPGVLADFVTISHTPDYFVFDFVTVVRARPGAAEGDVEIDGQVASRVKVLPSQVFEIMKALEQQLSQWEHETGRAANP